MPVNNALTPEGSNALGAAFGYYPQLRRNRQFNDPVASSEMPLQFLRGRFASTMGAIPDLMNLKRSLLPAEAVQALEAYGQIAPEVPYGSQYFQENLPLPPQGPAQQMAGAVGSVVPLSPAEILQSARLARQAALAGGKVAKKGATALGEEVTATLLGERPNTALGAITPSPMYAVPPSGRSGFGAFDPRYDPRVLEQARMQALTRDIQVNPNAKSGPTVSLADFEGRPFITSMADRTAAGGKLLGVENVQFNRPVEFLGGQDYMFNNPGLVWSSGNAPAKALMKYADEVKSVTGQNPIYMPYRMAPTGGDFAQFTGETMLAYADSAMGKTQKKLLDRSIKKFIPDWAGVSDPTSVAQFRDAPDAKRKAIKAMMDRDFRNEGGLNIGSARLAVSDPAQLAAQEGGVQNVGEIFAGNALQRSTHPAYPSGVPGQGIGTLAEDHNIFELLPDVVKARGIPDPKNPRPADLRAMQMHPYAGVISNALLKRLGY
tara:strand:- start:473 stop:1942 length:1470 start_codon:yes stop_codon:yes gene_type:complete